MDIVVTADGILRIAGRPYRCALGKGGILALKREGDGATPAGTFPLRRVLFRPDRMKAPATKLPSGALHPDDAWCDDTADPAYNQQIRVPHAAHHERLWREDHVYDVIVVVGHNDEPPVPGMGSAIFLHVARPDLSPTEGCVALPLADLLKVIELCDGASRIRIEG
jgi:L,D-peptidoglycan transpeptidase YkuD (ErfK/YbiS/YcfS/YnhG family)